ncbi:membrane hypothetical protein [Gammaproteobacteria bacterium]
MAYQQIIRQGTAALLVGWLGVGAAAEVAPVADSLSDSEISSFGCIAGGTGLLTAGYVAGPSEAILLWGGGLLVPSGSTVLAVSMVGALGAAGCSLGATLAPAVTWAYQRSSQWLASP